jgi:predicted nuclease of predicted toxin-antitoxin system
MKIKLDENLPEEVGQLLIAAGHDVHSVPDESLEGENDNTIFRAAVQEDRLLFTQDLDFSDIRQFAPGTHPGIVLIRVREPSRRRLIARIQQLLKENSIDEWNGCFVVASDRKLRIRRAK